MTGSGDEGEAALLELKELDKQISSLKKSLRELKRRRKGVLKKIPRRKTRSAILNEKMLQGSSRIPTASHEISENIANICTVDLKEEYDSDGNAAFPDTCQREIILEEVKKEDVSVSGMEKPETIALKKKKDGIREKEKCEFNRFICGTCGKGFQNKEKLELHNATMQPIPCEVCDRKFCYGAQFKNHGCSLPARTEFTCWNCGKVFSSDAHLTNHFIKRVCLDVFPCGVCSKIFESRGQLHRHVICHSEDRPFVCNLCGKSFILHKRLKAHERIHFGKEIRLDEVPEYTCDSCGKFYKSLDSLAKHIKREICLVKTFVCEVCGKVFIQRNLLRKHLIVHTDAKPYKCQTCGKSFAMKNRLKAHEATHLGLKPYQCDSCGKNFALAGTLKRHTKTHVNYKSSNVDEILPFLCLVCGKRFAQESLLKRHTPKHSGLKPYECELCNKSFSQKSNLKQHHLAHHSKVRPFSCDNCGRKCARKGTLDKHKCSVTFTHRPYPCLVCGKRFARRAYLKVHICVSKDVDYAKSEGGESTESAISGGDVSE